MVVTPAPEQTEILDHQSGGREEQHRERDLPRHERAHQAAPAPGIRALRRATKKRVEIGARSLQRRQ